MKFRFQSILLLSLLSAIMCCSKTDYPTKSIPFSAESFHGSCKEESGKIGKTTGGDYVFLSSFNDTVRVLHTNVRDNCCSEIKMEVKRTSSGFDIYEKDEGFSCDCICDFDVTCFIYGLSDGSYRIRIFDVEGTLFYQGLVTVKTTKPDGPNG